jgi:hypothetical protein
LTFDTDGFADNAIPAAEKFFSQVWAQHGY